MRTPARLAILLSALPAAASRCAAAEPSGMDKVRHPTARVTAPWKALADYPRPAAPDTGWGIHDHTNGDWYPPDADAFFKELKGKYGFVWFKILALGGNKVAECRAARRQGVEPVVRLYRSGHLPEYPKSGGQENELRKLVRDYVGAGAHYFEIANEPNLGGEWSSGHDTDDKIALLCANWLRVKKIVHEEGGIAVFYAMTPGSAGQWYRDCFETFKKEGRLEEAFAGAAIGVHTYTLNHPLDYPFDPKSNLPHATKEERLKSLLQDNTCFNIVELVMLLEDAYLPAQIPILGTEGGVSVGQGDDKRYPTTTMEIMTQMNMEIFNRMKPGSPGYWGDAFFSQMVWAYGGSGTFMMSGWFNNPQYGNLPILSVMEKAVKFDRGAAFK